MQIDIDGVSTAAEHDFFVILGQTAEMMLPAVQMCVPAWCADDACPTAFLWYCTYLQSV